MLQQIKDNQIILEEDSSPKSIVELPKANLMN